MGTKFQAGTPQTYTFTSADAQNKALAVYAFGYGAVLATFQVSGTVSAGVVTFEGQGGDGNWYSVEAASAAASATKAVTYTITSSGALVAAVGGFQAFRARLSTVITGSGSVLATLGTFTGDAVLT